MANFLEWLDSYSVGVEELDEDHKTLIKLANALLIEDTRKRGKDIVGEIIVELIEYIKTHFHKEETLMKSTGYPNFPEHKKKHDALIDEVFHFNDQYINRELDIVNISTFLLDWVITHIQQEDKEYTEHMHAHGIH